MKTKCFGYISSIAAILAIIFGLAPAASATCSPSSISLSPVSLNTITGSVDSVNTTTTIADDCGNPLTYTATVTGGSSWLSLPTSGKDTMKVTANNIKGLTHGIYTGKATLKASGLTDSSLTVTLTIGSTCSATLDNTLKMKVPIIKYTDSASVKYYFWLNEMYASNPSKILFKLSAYGSQNTTGYNCNMSWLDSDLMIYTRDVLYGGNFYWLKLAYDTSLSDSTNYYFYAKNYGEGSMSGADSSLYFGFSYGTTNTTSSMSSSTGSLPNGKAVSRPVSSEVLLTLLWPSFEPFVSGTVSFEVLLTNGAASEAVGALGYLNSDYSFSCITTGIFTKTTSDGQKLFEKIEFGTDGLPASLKDYSTGYTTTFSSYSNGTVHIKVVDSTGAVVVSDKQINIEAEWFTYFSNQIAKSYSAEKTLEAIGYAMGTIFDKITYALAPETTAGNSACGGLIAAATAFGCDLTKTKYGLCGYINVVPDGLAGAATLASCVANIQTQSVSSSTGSSVVDCTKDITAKVIEKAAVNFVKEITPGSGAVGTAVIITGTGFGSTEGTVTFNGTTATITSWAEKEIKTTVPAGASTGYVVVTDATGMASNGVMYTVITVNAYTVTPSAGTGGSISPSTPQTVAQGATTIFTVTPNTGYTASVSGTCGGNLSGNTYTTNAITASCTVVASFTQSTVNYTVTPSAGTGGSISPSTPQTVAQGATTTFTVTPNTGYTASVSGTCGGTLSGSTYTTNAITASCTVVASFTQSTSSSVFKGSITGTWQGTCPSFGGASVSGGFSMTIDANGIATGSYSGTDSGSINGTVNTSGNFSSAGSAGSAAWSGHFSVSGTTLSGSGTWSDSSFGCSGSWSGTGTTK